MGKFRGSRYTACSFSHRRLGHVPTSKWSYTKYFEVLARNDCYCYPLPPLVLLSVPLPQAVEINILEWVSLLHMRTPLCTVLLVASHYDMLLGTPEENEQLLGTVEQRFVHTYSRNRRFLRI